MYFRQRLEQLQQNQVQTQDKINTWNETQTTIKNKKALLIGCNYSGTRYALNGCINDAKLMEKLLKEKFSFNSVSLMTDDTQTKPNKVEILKAVEDLIKNAKENDFLYIYFSGHGIQMDDLNNDENDGKDEAYVSLDFQKVLDDELYSIVKKHDKNIKIMFMFDCCHSGTIMDFPYNLYGQSSSSLHDFKATCVCLSGCRDAQYSYESQLGGTRHGALTYFFNDIMTKVQGPFTYKFLMNKLQEHLSRSQFNQNTQISATKSIPWDSARFILF
jgi:hypothetical protein